MKSRRNRRGRKKARALSDFINSRLPLLRILKRYLNAEHGPRPVDDDIAVSALADRVTPVIEATLGAVYPDLPDEAIDRFNALADQAPVRFLAGNVPRPEDDEQFVIGLAAEGFAGAPIQLRSATPEGLWVAWLVDFFDNPQRERLRRCHMCRRWFVDETRNKSARRCSRKCTIAWSNAQRPKGAH